MDSGFTLEYSLFHNVEGLKDWKKGAEEKYTDYYYLCPQTSSHIQPSLKIRAREDKPVLVKYKAEQLNSTQQTSIAIAQAIAGQIFPSFAQDIRSLGRFYRWLSTHPTQLTDDFFGAIQIEKQSFFKGTLIPIYKERSVFYHPSFSGVQCEQIAFTTEENKNTSKNMQYNTTFSGSNPADLLYVAIQLNIANERNINFDEWIRKRGIIPTITTESILREKK